MRVTSYKLRYNELNKMYNQALIKIIDLRMKETNLYYECESLNNKFQRIPKWIRKVFKAE